MSDVLLTATVPCRLDKREHVLPDRGGRIELELQDFLLVGLADEGLGMVVEGWRSDRAG